MFLFLNLDRCVVGVGVGVGTGFGTGFGTSSSFVDCGGGGQARGRSSGMSGGRRSGSDCSDCSDCRGSLGSGSGSSCSCRSCRVTSTLGAHAPRRGVAKKTAVGSAHCWRDALV